MYKDGIVNERFNFTGVTFGGAKDVAQELEQQYIDHRQ